MNPEYRAGVLVYGPLVVREPGAVRGAYFPEAGPGELQHLGDAEAAPYLYELPARDDHLRSLRGSGRDESREREERGPRAVVDDQRVLGAGQLPQERHRVIVARASSTGAEIVLQIGVAGGRIVGCQ